MANLSENLDAIEQAFKDMEARERTRITSERDFLKAVLRNSGLGGRVGTSSTDKFSDLFTLDELDRFFEEPPSS